MAYLPDANDGPNELIRKILLQLLSMATNPPANLYPGCCDGPNEMWRKILLTLNYI